MIKRQILLVAVVLGLCAAAFGQTKNFTPVDGATLKAKFESAIASGKANTTNGRFWVGYQFEVRPGVAIDFEIVDSAGGIYMAVDGTSMMFDARHETRELGLFMLYDEPRASFTRMIRTARNHPKMAVRKLAIQMLGQTGDERAVAFFRELLSKE